MLSIMKKQSTFTKMSSEYLIRTVYEYDGEYHFTVTPGKEFSFDDSRIFEEVVDKKTGSIKMINPATIVEGFMGGGLIGLARSRKYMSAVKASEPVDLKPEEWEQMKACIDSF